MLDLFKDTPDANLYDAYDKVYVECLKFSLMHLIQANLERIAQRWHLHDTRQQKHTDVPSVPSGQPEFFILYQSLVTTTDQKLTENTFEFKKSFILLEDKSVAPN